MKKVFVVIIPWDYATANVIGVFKKREDAEHCKNNAKNDEYENWERAFISEEVVE